MNAFKKWEIQFVNTINVAFFYRAMIYLLTTIYAFVIIPIQEGFHLFPNPTWFFVHFLAITGLALLSHANYPNHLTKEDIQRRLLVALIPPALFLQGIKDRWYDFKILINRDQYGSILLFVVIGGMSIVSFFYVAALLLLVLDLGPVPLLFVFVYTLVMISPLFLLDYYMLWKNTQNQDPEVDESWEQGTVTGEYQSAVRPPLLSVVNTKRKRLWIAFLIIISYGLIIWSLDSFDPILAN